MHLLRHLLGRLFALMNLFEIRFLAMTLLALLPKIHKGIVSSQTAVKHLPSTLKTARTPSFSSRSATATAEGSICAVSAPLAGHTDCSRLQDVMFFPAVLLSCLQLLSSAQSALLSQHILFSLTGHTVLTPLLHHYITLFQLSCLCTINLI